ncbi:MAG: type I methionyl aminopeptidase [Candidatus Aminicenantes bacterium]|nr:type I methionyl aminopeptidase [Candidatus Aminicenantes bacterium]
MIVFKSPEEVGLMRQASQIVARILGELKPRIKPGVRTIDLDAYAESRAQELGAQPAFKGYRGYPAALCTSINEEVVHGIPSSRELEEGDIVSLDFGVLYRGFYGDAAVTFPVGRVGAHAQHLIETAEQALTRGLEELHDGQRVSDYSHAVQEFVESRGLSVIRAFVGHGIGHALHEEPQVPNFGLPGRGPKVRPGMTLALEPMIAAGDWEVEILADGWTAVTRDRSLAAHFEHTVVLTEAGVEILTFWDNPALSAEGRRQEKNYA